METGVVADWHVLPTPNYGRRCRKVWSIIGPGTHNMEGPSYLSCVAPRTCFTPNLDHSFNVTRYHTFQETTIQQHAVATDSFNSCDLRRKREGRRVWSSGPQDRLTDMALKETQGEVPGGGKTAVHPKMAPRPVHAAPLLRLPKEEIAIV